MSPILSWPRKGIPGYKIKLISKDIFSDVFCDLLLFYPIDIVHIELRLIIIMAGRYRKSHIWEELAAL